MCISFEIRVATTICYNTLSNGIRLNKYDDSMNIFYFGKHILNVFFPQMGLFLNILKIETLANVMSRKIIG